MNYLSLSVQFSVSSIYSVKTFIEVIEIGTINRGF